MMRLVTNADRWWPAGAPSAAAPVRLLCLPYAGGGASIYRPWREALAPVDVCPLQLPGREGRIREAPFRTMEEVVPALIEVLKGSVDPPYGIFGYSLGAGIAFEVVRRLRPEGILPPCVLLVAAAPAPHRGRRERLLHGLPDAAFREALRELDGTPESVLEHEELMDLMMPTLRADFAIHETHRPALRDGAPPQVDVPIVAFGGAEDASVPPGDLEAWEEVTRSSFRMRTFPGGHFFLSSHGGELREHVRAALAEAAPW